MARRQPLNDDERRLLRITARMPLASVANLAPALGMAEDKLRSMLGALRSAGWSWSYLNGTASPTQLPIDPVEQSPRFSEPTEAVQIRRWYCLPSSQAQLG